MADAALAADRFTVPGRHWHRLADGRVECDVCPRSCRLHEGQQVADVLEPLWNDPGVLLVCSTELSHYHDAQTARRLDERTAEAVLARDVAAIAPAAACCADALRGLLAVANRSD